MCECPHDSVEGRAALAYVVSLDEITGKDLAGSNSTVVRTLRSGETALGPTVRRTIRVEESVLLLESEPGFVLVPPELTISASSATKYRVTPNTDSPPWPSSCSSHRSACGCW